MSGQYSPFVLDFIIENNHILIIYKIQTILINYILGDVCSCFLAFTRQIVLEVVVGGLCFFLRPVTSHWQTLSQCCIDYTSPWNGIELTTLVVIGTDCTCTGSCKSNYHTIMTTINVNSNTFCLAMNTKHSQ